MMIKMMIMSGMAMNYDGSEMKVFARRHCSVESPLRCVGTGTPFLADPLC